jgi:hypothetical protein
MSRGAAKPRPGCTLAPTRHEPRWAGSALPTMRLDRANTRVRLSLLMNLHPSVTHLTPGHRGQCRAGQTRHPGLLKARKAPIARECPSGVRPTRTWLDPAETRSYGQEGRHRGVLTSSTGSGSPAEHALPSIGPQAPSTGRTLSRSVLGSDPTDLCSTFLGSGSETCGSRCSR